MSLHDTVCASSNAIGPAATELSRGAGDEVVDAVGARVLEVVLVPAEHDAHARVAEARHQRLHVARVVMARPGASTAGDGRTGSASGTRRLGDREGLLEERLMLRMFEQPPAREEMLLRRVDANELDVAAEPHPIEQARDRATPCPSASSVAIRSRRKKLSST